MKMRKEGKPRPAPLGRSFWVIEDKLLAGFYPGDQDPKVAQAKIGKLFEAGIRTFVNLMEVGETNWDRKPFVSYEKTASEIAAAKGETVAFERLSIRDQGVPGAVFMTHILDRIDASIGTGRPVYVHCWGGRGRTGTVIGCYLARHGVATGNEALQELNRLRSHTADADKQAPDTEAQRQFVRDWRPTT